jgi:hypothetical protein
MQDNKKGVFGGSCSFFAGLPAGASRADVAFEGLFVDHNALMCNILITCNQLISKAKLTIKEQPT